MERIPILKKAIQPIEKFSDHPPCFCPLARSINRKRGPDWRAAAYRAVSASAFPGTGTCDDMWRPDCKYLIKISLILQAEMSAQRSFLRYSCGKIIRIFPHIIPVLQNQAYFYLAFAQAGNKVTTCTHPREGGRGCSPIRRSPPIRTSFPSALRRSLFGQNPYFLNFLIIFFAIGIAFSTK